MLWQGAGAYFESAAIQSDCAYALALAAALHMMTLTNQGRQRAAPFIARSKAAAASATTHEQTFVAAVYAWASSNMVEASRLHSALAQSWPQDFAALKIGHFHNINCGDFFAMRSSLAPVAAALPDAPYIDGMRAFALDQCGEHLAAERAADRALSLADDPWAHHAMAHVFDGTNRMAEGRAWMLAARRSWSECSSFLYTHNWWHTALFALAEGDVHSALMLYDQHVWGIRRDYAQDQVNAISLLSRFELHGIDVGNRWADLLPHVQNRTTDRENGFVDLHYVYALARAGDIDRCRSMMVDWDTCADAVTLSHHAKLSRIMARAARGVTAHAYGDMENASMYLRRVRASLQQLGGSHTQRHWFDLLLQDSLRADHAATLRKFAA